MNAMHQIGFGSMCCALLLAGSAQAGEQFQTQEFTTELAVDKADALVTQDLFATPFNPALGSLKSISITVELGVEGRFGVENLAEKERSIPIGCEARVAVFVAANREVAGCTAAHQSEANLKGFDGVLDWRGKSAIHHKLSGDQISTVVLNPHPYWLSTTKPQGAALRVQMIGLMRNKPLTEGCMQVGAKATIRVSYQYDDLNSANRFERGADDVFRAEAPVHAWREDSESPLA